MIDFVVCRRRFKSTLVNARAYGGTRKGSDHKLVCARFQFRNRHLTFPQRVKSDEKFDCNTLSSNPDIQVLYSTKLSELIVKRSAEDENYEDAECNARMDNLVSSIKLAAKDVVGLRPKQTDKDFTNDPEVVNMSNERHDLRMLLNTNASANTRVIRTRINQLKKLIDKRLVHLKELRAQDLADRIKSTDESRRMFEAVRELKTNTSKNRAHQQSVSVHDENKNLISTDTGKAAALKDWFQSQFTKGGTEPALEAFDGPPRSVNTSITPGEVQRAAMSLNNNRATGPDGIQGELVKYGGVSFCVEYSKIINKCMETNTHLHTIGEAIITPLQKAGKTKGPPQNTRLLTLSNIKRKILSLITLRRIQQQVDNYTGPWQAAYKRGRSCGDFESTYAHSSSHEETVVLPQDGY